MFTRIAIVNRGEAAMRLIHAVRGLSEETGQPIEVIALHTDVDRNATFVREADVAYDLGPAASRPYLNMKVLEQIVFFARLHGMTMGAAERNAVRNDPPKPRRRRGGRRSSAGPARWRP